MADTKISDLATLASASIDKASDLFVVVDVSDTSMAATGTDKKTTLSAIATNVIRESKSFAVNSAAVESYPGFFVALATGQTASIAKVRYKTASGTATVTVRKGGSAAHATYTNLSVTSTAATATQAVSLAEDDYIDINVTAASSAVDLVVTVVIEHTVT